MELARSFFAESFDFLTEKLLQAKTDEILKGRNGLRRKKLTN